MGPGPRPTCGSWLANGWDSFANRTSDPIMFSFRTKAPVDEDEFAWLIACFAWLHRVLDDGDPARFEEMELIQPNAQFFPPTEETGHNLAIHLFEQTKALCGMADWPCKLVEGERQREIRVQPGLAINHESSPPLGLFVVESGGVEIAYDPDLLASPSQLVATFAHELAHYLLYDRGDPPGGPDLVEHATDCAAVYLGFGLFSTNAALSFRQFASFDESGWERRSAGYLSEAALLTATSLFVHLSKADTEAAEAVLKPHLRKSFRKALKAVSNHLPDGAVDLARVDLSDWV